MSVKEEEWAGIITKIRREGTIKVDQKMRKININVLLISVE